MAESQESINARRQRILAMKPDDRALLAEIMLKRHEQTARDIAQLQARQADTSEWLKEFAPELAPLAEVYGDAGQDPEKLAADNDRLRRLLTEAESARVEAEDRVQELHIQLTERAAGGSRGNA